MPLNDAATGRNEIAGSVGGGTAGTAASVTSAAAFGIHFEGIPVEPSFVVVRRIENQLRAIASRRGGLHAVSESLRIPCCFRAGGLRILADKPRAQRVRVFANLALIDEIYWNCRVQTAIEDCLQQLLAIEIAILCRDVDIQRVGLSTERLFRIRWK